MGWIEAIGLLVIGLVLIGLGINSINANRRYISGLDKKEKGSLRKKGTFRLIMALSATIVAAAVTFSADIPFPLKLLMIALTGSISIRLADFIYNQRSKQNEDD